jgi:hypothetical protein
MVLTEIMRAFDRVRQMERNNPLLAFACLAEAIGDGRIRGDACASAQLAEIRDMARRAVRSATGAEFFNELYPE